MKHEQSFFFYAQLKKIGGSACIILNLLSGTNYAYVDEKVKVLIVTTLFSIKKMLLREIKTVLETVLVSEESLRSCDILP